MSKKDHQIHTRVPERLKEQLEEAAKVTGRSVNAEVVSRLERSFGRSEDEEDYSSKLVKISAIEREICSIDLLLEDLTKNPFYKRGIKDSFYGLRGKLEDELKRLKS